MSKNELYKMFKNQNPTFTRKFSTFLKYIPKQYKNLDMRCRRVCVCTKCYNMEKKVEAMNAITRKYDKPELKITLRELSEKTLCEFEHRPHRICVDRVCGSCGTDRVNLFYQPVLEKIDQEEKVLFYQWEQVSEKYISREGKEIKTKRWVQAEKRLKPCDLVDMISEEMELFTGHLFRADYQHMVENQLMSNLPLDQAVVVMDFSENISLTPQDEIESAHWTIKQVTLHPIFIVRHAPESTIEKPVIQKESLIIVSDCLAHNAESVFVFTKKLIAHLQNNPGPCEIKTIHRFSDNCSVQYKCKYAFSHLIQLEEEHNLKLVYHFTESGHGKGPSDGLGAAVKMRLQRLILGEQRVVNNAYQVYLALTQTQVSSTQRACQNIIYVPQRVINQGKPQKVSVKTIKGTQSYHMVHSCEKGVLKCNDLSCGCQVCICDQEGPCFYSQYRHDAVFHPMLVERRSAERSLPNIGDGEDISTYDDSSDQVCCEVIQNSCSDFIEQQQQTETALQEFTEHISKQGWKIRGVTPMDGNCFFWAVSDQLIRLHLDFQSHEELRNAVVDFISSFPKEKRNEMTEFLTTPFSTYIQSMQKNSTYADHIAIQAMSSVLGAHINIVHANKNSNVVLHPAESDSRTVLVVGYLENLQHYVSLDRIGPEDFVIVELTAGKRKQKYVAKVLETDTDDIKVRFMKKTATKGVFTWHEKDQIYWQSMSEIVRILKQPDLVPGRGIKLKFSEDLVF